MAIETKSAFYFIKTQEATYIWSGGASTAFCETIANPRPSFPLSDAFLYGFGSTFVLSVACIFALTTTPDIITAESTPNIQNEPPESFQSASIASRVSEDPSPLAQRQKHWKRLHLWVVLSPADDPSPATQRQKQRKCCIC